MSASNNISENLVFFIVYNMYLCKSTIKHANFMIAEHLLKSLHIRNSFSYFYLRINGHFFLTLGISLISVVTFSILVSSK